MTVLDHLIGSLRQAADFNRHELVGPRVVLWTDGERLWTRALPLLEDAVPELLILDGTRKAERRGPATWIRYRIARGQWREPPIVYVPGIARPAFRGAAGFPSDARHLFALQFLAQFWTQANGKDWTPSAFVSSADGGLGLDLARDKATLEALAAQLEHVLRTPVADLRRKRLEAADLHGLVASDPVRLVLEWVGDPAGSRSAWTPQQWKGFCALCRERFGLDPEKDGAITAIERLVAGQGQWNDVWNRYREAPRAFAGVRKALDRVQPKDLLDAGNERLPAVNRQQEDNLRRELAALTGLSASIAQDKLAHLCEEHVRRASSAWAALGESPLAEATVHLSALLSGIQKGFGANTWAGLAERYLSDGWVIDASVWKALAAARETGDWKAVCAAIRVVYAPWLETLAETTASLAAAYPNPTPATCGSLMATPGTIVLFADGLRTDLALEVREALMRARLHADFHASWSALPTVTGTAKPAWRPMADRLMGELLPEGFEPQQKSNGRLLKTAEFRKLLAELGWAWVEPTADGDPELAGWTECGSFDRYGHDDGARLAWRIQEELKAVESRIRQLLEAGWKTVVVTTDHGWLMMPGGLPHVALPTHLTASKWGRCAIAQAGAQHRYRRVPWFWGGQHEVVIAPGISVFKSGLEYAHGGLTLQEALVPQLTVKRGAVTGAAVRIEATRWSGLRLHVQLTAADPEASVDVRSKPADADSSMLSMEQRSKAPGADGRVSVQVEDDELIGHAAVVVVVRGGQVIDKKSVTIGEE